MQTANALYRFGYEELKNKLVEKEGNTVKIPVLKLLPYLHTSFLFEWVSEYGFSEKQLTDIRQLLRAENGRFVQSENFQIIRHNRWLIIAPKNLDNSLYVIEEGQTDLAFSNGVLLIRKYPKDKWRLNTAAIVAQLDIKEIRFPLVLRRWKSSDYFYPLGMRKKKKLARFFIDLKLSKDKKEQAWVLESDKRIIWVAGFRIDDRFKVTESTKEILELQVKLL
jgi:tRNA(Ile)-lysidine synthase